MKKILLIIIFSALLTFIPLTIVWIHHQFIAGLNPFFAVIITPVFLVMAFFIFRFLFKMFKKHISFTPDVLFAIALFSYLIAGCILQIFNGNSAFDIHLHDIYYVGSRYYSIFFVSIAFAMFAAIYYWFYKISRTQMNNTLGYIHFWITFLAISFFILPMHDVGLAGMPRRYYNYSDSHVFNAIHEQNIFISITGFLLLVAQLIFVYNFCNSIFKKSNLNKKANA